MAVPTYDEICEKNLPMCEKCSAMLQEQKGRITVEGIDGSVTLEPRMWRHSERDIYHAWIRVHERHVFLCGTRDFDEITLKRIRPLKRDDVNTWTISLGGMVYHVAECEDRTYEILNEDGTIVKDEEIEAKVFNHMMKIV